MEFSMEFSMVVQQLLIAGDELRKTQKEQAKLREQQVKSKKNAYNNQRKKSKVDIDEEDDE